MKSTASLHTFNKRKNRIILIYKVLLQSILIDEVPVQNREMSKVKHYSLKDEVEKMASAHNWTLIAFFETCA